MAVGWRRGISLSLTAVSFMACLGSLSLPAQQLDNSSVIQRIDAAVKARTDQIAGYTVTEHYAVYRNQDESHPVAEMVVKTVYRQDAGKSYTILSQTGSQIIRSLVLGALLDNEKTINLPGTREGAWITSANYQMKLKSGSAQLLDGRDCLVLSLTPRRKTPYLIDGTLWVDANDYSIVQIEGTGAKSPSVFAGPTRMARQYANISGFAEATHAKAVSNSLMFGQTIVKIDYQDYQIQLRPAQ